MRRLALIALLALVILVLAVQTGVLELLLTIGLLPLVAADKLAGLMGADKQVAEPGRPRRGGLGGGDSAESTEALDPSGSENPNSGRPRQRSRPRRSGF